MVLSGRLLSLALRLTVGAGLATLIACGMASSDATAAGFGGPEKPGDGDGSLSPPSPPNGGADSGKGAPVGSGVVLVHAARFPSFRLCFENYPEMRPQPDSTVMPAANRVGLEIGSVVRIPPLTKAPGKVYVLDRSTVSAAAGETEVPCGQRICDPQSSTTCRRLYADYQVAGSITSPLGVNQVDLLAVTNCGSGIFLEPGSNGATECAPIAQGDPPWDVTAGNLLARSIRLSPTTTAATNQRLPVQLVHLSPEIERHRNGSPLVISFGDLAAQGKLGQDVASNPGVFTTATQQDLTVTQTDIAFYGKHGFRITFGGNPALAFDQSLAQVQELSAPNELPTNYFLTASNYALLLLGDTRARGADAGGPPDERRGVHLLAIPIVEPKSEEEEGDAGAAEGDGG